MKLTTAQKEEMRLAAKIKLAKIKSGWMQLRGKIP